MPERAARWCVALMSSPTATRPGPAWICAPMEPSVSASTTLAPPWSSPYGWVLPATGIVATRRSGETSVISMFIRSMRVPSAIDRMSSRVWPGACVEESVMPGSYAALPRTRCPGSPRRWPPLGLPCEPTSPPRRTLAGLPRVLRAPRRELLDEHGAAHERRLRLHLDAHQHAARRGADARRRGLRQGPPVVPHRRVRRVQGGPCAHARRVPGPDPAREGDPRRAPHPLRRARRLRGRRHHRDVRDAGRGPGHRRPHLLGRPRHLPARLRQGDDPLPDPRRVRGVADGPGPGRGEVRRPPDPLQRPRRHGRRDLRQPPGRARCRPQDRGEVDHPVRRPRRHRREHRQDPGQGGAVAARPPRPGPAQPPAQQLVKDSPVGVGVEDLQRSQWSREEVHTVFDGLEFRVLRDRLFATVEAAAPEAEEGFDIAGAVLAPEGEAALGGWFEDAARPKAMHDAKGPIEALAARGWTLAGLTSDTQLAAYLVKPDQRTYHLDDLVLRNLHRELSGAAPTDGQGMLDFGGDADE